MLGSHPGIAIPYESHLYNRVYPLVRRAGMPADPQGIACLVKELLRTQYIREWTPPPTLEATLAALERPDFHGIVDAILRSWAAGQGKRRWGEKTPQHTLWWRTIRAGFPDLQVIHLVRDGRDVALSYRAAPFGPTHVYHLARRWVHYLDTAAEAEAALGSGAFLTVRYEDLLREPEAVLRRVCDHLGEEFAAEMLSFHRDPVAYPTDPRNEDNLRRPVLTDNAEKWRKAMSDRDVRIFEALAGSALEHQGYTRAKPGAAISPTERLSCLLLESPPRRALSLLRNRQGHEHALEVLRLRLALRYRC
jgi:hypothetical protein